MNVSLTPKLVELVESKVDSGMYSSASEVVREALRLLDERDRLREQQLSTLRDEVSIGLRDVRDGRITMHSDAELATLAELIKSEGRRRRGAESQ